MPHKVTIEFVEADGYVQKNTIRLWLNGKEIVTLRNMRSRRLLGDE